MSEALAHQMRRGLLDVLREEGGQASWRNLPTGEYDVLQQMEQEGIIERVAETGRSTGSFTYRLKPEPQGSE